MSAPDPVPAGQQAVTRGRVFWGDKQHLRALFNVYSNAGTQCQMFEDNHGVWTLHVAEPVDYAGIVDRIAAAHEKHVDSAGGNSGYCPECSLVWPCPTSLWASGVRDPILDAWNPAEDDYDEEWAVDA